MKFSSDYILAGFTNNILINRYQPYGGGSGPIQLNNGKWNLNDSLVIKRLHTIKRVKIAAINSRDFLEPYQSEIATNSYPLARMVYCIQRDGKVGLGTGLQRFLYDETGQLIALKFGLMPFRQPERSLHFNEQ